MNDINENIPTLTDIISIGDEDMLNHFSAEQFTQRSESSEDVSILSENSFEEAEDISSSSTGFSTENPLDNLNSSETDEGEDEGEDDDINSIPSITMMSETQLDISDEDFSEAMQRNYQSSEETSTADVSEDELNEEIRQQIDAAVDAILPDIKLQLQNSLYNCLKR